MINWPLLSPKSGERTGSYFLDSLPPFSKRISRLEQRFERFTSRRRIPNSKKRYTKYPKILTPDFLFRRRWSGEKECFQSFIFFLSARRRLREKWTKLSVFLPTMRKKR